MNTARPTFFADALEQWGDRAAVIDESGREHSYTDLRTRADALASQLGAVRRLVFIEATTSLHTIVAYLAALRARHVVHLLDPSRPDFNDALIDLYQPNFIVGTGASAFRLRTHNPKPVYLHDDLCLLLATSGSTGSPKLVKLSRHNIQSNTAAIIDYLQLTPSDRAISSLKLHYSYGLSILNTHLAAGSSFVLTARSVTDPQFWHAFSHHRVTSFSGVPHTFDLLQRARVPLHDLPSLRYVTQAGGVMPPEQVRALAEAGQRSGWSLYVMYGQTEASPRIAYLPPSLAIDHPRCIGVPIPGGEMILLDDDAQEINRPDTPGELAYRGPNIMIGYALRPDDLAVAEDIPQLRTGDLACRNPQGLYYIVGRKHRFIKPFGIRLNLDDVERHLTSLGIEAAVSGDDHGLVAAVCGQNTRTDDLQHRLAQLYSLPLDYISVIRVAELPRLANGKLDHAHLPDLPRQRGKPPRVHPSPPGALRRFAGLFVEELKRIASPAHRWASVREIFELSLRPASLTDDDTFMTLEGDSLSYVQLSLSLERYLGALPPRWETFPIRQLEAMRSPVAV